MRIVGVSRSHAVAIVDQQALSLRIVVNVCDEWCPYRVVVPSRTAQVGVESLEKIGLVVGRAYDALVRRNWAMYCADLTDEYPPDGGETPGKSPLDDLEDLL